MTNLHDNVWDDDWQLLLIYKDRLDKKKSVADSPLISSSHTIETHLEYAKGQQRGYLKDDPILNIASQRQLSFVEEIGNTRLASELPAGNSVWGWWRKPWESHNRLLHRLQEALSQGHRPRVLLYNQYVRRLYSATLNGVYFETGLTTVVVPAHWAHACPAYYRGDPHLCGAFFALEIEPEERDANALRALFIDSLTLDREGDRWSVAIPRPDHVSRTLHQMVDRAPNRLNLRTSEQTMLLVRPTRQKDKTAALLSETSTEPPARAVTETVRETMWEDLLAVLGEAPPPAWRRLAGNTAALEEIGRKSRAHGAKPTRFDIELAADCLTDKRLDGLFLSGEHPPEFTNLGRAMRSWATSAEERQARISAADVFREAWRFAQDRYHLAELAPEYFNKLPAMEAIANAVKHEIGEKFYRDHLSHNIRAALLAVRLAKTEGYELDGDSSASLVAFYAGLFHDLALPVTSFPESIVEIWAALTKILEIGERPTPTPPNVVLDSQVLRRCVSYAAMLASTPELSKAYSDRTFAPWDGLEGVTARADTRLLVETLQCATTHEHAIVSAATILDYAVKGFAKEYRTDYDTAVRSLMASITGPKAESWGTELTGIIQSIALHDRRPATKHHGVKQPPKDTPRHLDAQLYPSAVIVAIADELQEWGRTIGRLDQVAAVDASIEMAGCQVTAAYTLSTEADVFDGIPFSLLEYVFGKFRTLSRIAGADGSSLEPTFRLRHLGAFQLAPIAEEVCRIHFDEPFEQNGFSGGGDSGGSFSGGRLFSVGSRNADKPRDLVFVDGGNEVWNELESMTPDERTLKEVSVGNNAVEFVTTGGLVVRGVPSEYVFGRLAENSVPANKLLTGERCALIKLVLGDETSFAGRRLAAAAPHLMPHSHFLDYDWRFSSNTCRAIVRLARELAAAAKGPICYLGCPSLAVWHQKQYPQDRRNWVLLDRGHYALETWLQSGIIDRAHFKEYDVFDEVPDGIRAKYAVVVTDPPWYDPEYIVFCRRADELLSRSGVLGVTYYPASLDEGKYELFQKLVFATEIRELQLFGAIEVDYERPAFEAATGIDRKFEHPALGIYRPGFMDFYIAPPTRPAKPKATLDRPPALPLTVRLPLDGDHHIVLRDSLEYPLRASLARCGIKRPKAIDDRVLGWTSHNIVVVRGEDDARTINDQDTLIALLKDPAPNIAELAEVKDSWLGS